MIGSLFNSVLSLFVFMAGGYLLVRVGIVRPEDAKPLSAIATYLFFPLIIINSFQTELTPEMRAGMVISVSAAILIHIILIIYTKLIRKPLHLTPLEEAAVIYSNAGTYSVVMVTQTMGSEWLAFSFFFIAVQTVMLWSHAKMLVCEEKKVDILRILKNPNMISVLIGLALMFLGIRLPGFVRNIMGMANGSIGPLGMILSGIILGGVDLKKMFFSKRIYLISALRLVLLPILLIATFRLIAVFVPVYLTRMQIVFVAILAAITPPAGTIVQQARLYDKDAGYATALSTVSTVLCLATMPVIMMFFEWMWSL